MKFKERADDNIAGGQAAYDSAYNFYIEDLKKEGELKLIKLIIPGRPDWNAEKTLEDYRIDEFGVDDIGDSAVFYDSSFITKIEGVLSIVRTLLVCMLLGCGTYFFNKDANVLVLQPIERMMEKISIISKDPMAICADDDDIAAAGMLGMMQKKDKKKKNKK